MSKLSLQVLPDLYSICKLSPDSAIPEWALSSAFVSISRSSDELSILAPEPLIPSDLRQESGWRGLEVSGPLDFSMVGVIHSLTAPLVEIGVSVFVVSTILTDHLFVKGENLERSLEALRKSDILSSVN